MQHHRFIRTGMASLLLMTQLAGCYHYVPVRASQLPAGTRVTVGLTDRGRVALTDAVGPGAKQIGGDVLEMSDSAVILAVSNVEHFDLGLPVRWAGERVAVSRDYVAEIRERRLSRSRSWMMAGLIAVGTAVISTVAIRGFGTDEGSNKPDDGGGGQQIIRFGY